MAGPLSSGHVTVNIPVFEEDEACIHAAALIESIQRIAGLLIDPHHADIRTGPERFFQSCNRIIGVRVRTTRACIHIHEAELCATNRSRKPGSAVYGHLLASHRIYSNLTAEEQLILISNIKIKDSGVFEEKLALLRNKDFERCQIEWLKVDFGVGKISVACEIQDDVGGEAVFEVDSTRQREFRVLSGLLIILS